MKDNIILLAAGLVCAALAWMFFDHLQESAFTIMLVIFVITIVAKSIYRKYRSYYK